MRRILIDRDLLVEIATIFEQQIRRTTPSSGSMQKALDKIDELLTLNNKVTINKAWRDELGRINIEGENLGPKVINTQAQRTIVVHIVQKEGPHKTIIRAICSNIRLQISGGQFYRKDKIKDALICCGVRKYEINEIPIVYPMNWNILQNILIDFYRENSRITILMSMLNDNTIRFSVATDSDSVWYMEDL